MIKNIVKNMLPNFLLEKIISIKRNSLFGHSYTSYSQEGEDMILRRLFENQSKGFYIDVGAHHPSRFSNTYYFYKKGWKGINIDAMPGSMKKFNILRPRDLNIEIPISDSKKLLTYYAFNESALNGFSYELSQTRIVNSGGSYYLKFTKEIETSTLEEVLDQHINENHVIDFLTIDVEGLDLNVILSNNFYRYKPRVILVEILSSTLPELYSHEITVHLQKFGYKIIAKSINTVFFILDS